MANEFNAGMEEAFDDFWSVDGEENALFNGVEIPVLVGEFNRRTEVGVAGAVVVIAGTISLRVADWVSSGLKQGAALTLPNGRTVRIEAEPYIGPDGGGVIDVAVIAK